MHVTNKWSAPCWADGFAERCFVTAFGENKSSASRSINPMPVMANRVSSLPKTLLVMCSAYAIACDEEC